MDEQPAEPGVVGDTNLGIPGDPEPMPDETEEHPDTPDDDDDPTPDDDPEEVEDGVEDDEGTEPNG